MKITLAPMLLALSIAALFLPAGRARAGTPQKGDEMIFGCQGEGCGCTGATKTSKPFTLYRQMNAQSAVIAEYKTPVDATAGDAFTLVKEPGQHRIVALRQPVAGLKVGSLVTRLFHHGEGFWQASLNGNRVEFQEAVQASWKTLRPTKLETWYQITVQGQSGYATTFPFRTCHE